MRLHKQKVNMKESLIATVKKSDSCHGLELEKFPDDSNVVVLVSASGAGCGSTTVARLLRDKLGTEAQIVLVGERVRELCNIRSELDAQELDGVPALGNFDDQIYTNLDSNVPVVVEGKHATAVGPQVIDGKRKIYALNLTAPTEVTAARVLRREGIGLVDLILHPQRIVDYLTMINKRNEHIRAQIAEERRPDSLQSSNVVDTSLFHPEEVVSYIFQDDSWLVRSPKWEIEALRQKILQLQSIFLDHRIEKELRDLQHFRINIEALEYQLIHRLCVTTNAPGLAEIRAEIRSRLQGAIFSLLIKKIPRFFVRQAEQDGEQLMERQIDLCSQKWTPEYYKLAISWPTLKTILQDQELLDPFAGSGVLAHVLSAHGIPKSLVCADLSYPGGLTLNDTDYYYDPQLNTHMMRIMFDDLPSWYKPEGIRNKSMFVTHDANQLPFPNRAFDMIVTDPPYGFNLNDGGIEFFVTVLPELLRVVRKGCLLIVPQAWLNELDKRGVNFDLLVNDLSNGSSHHPTVLIYIGSCPVN